MSSGLTRKMSTQEAIERAKAKGLQGPTNGHASPTVDKARVAELAARIGRGKDLRQQTYWPGADLEIALAVLSVSEMDEAEAAALRAVEQRYGDSEAVTARSVSEALARAQVTEYLARAIEEPGQPGAKVFESAPVLARVATEGELEALWQEYQDHKDSVDPDLETLSEEELKEIERLAKKKDGTSLRRIASSLPRSSLRSMVAVLVTSLEHSSSST